MSFEELGLADAVLHGVQSMGFVDPTPVQTRAIPLILEGKDVVGSAQTGTGKTAAFALPILSKMKEHGPLRCLVLEPTRELASQVFDAFNDYSRFSDLRSTVIYGGVGYGKQRDDLKNGVDVIVATPGRLLDHLKEGAIKLETLEFLVLDEVDRMLDMGFLPDVRRIIQQCPKDRQTLFFSATMPPEIAGFSEWVLRDPVMVEIGIRMSTAETVAHALYPVAMDQKFDLLAALLHRTEYHSVLVFTRTKMGADMIANRLDQEKHSVTVMHSNRSQAEREEALQGFKSNKYEVMVATDIASRGIDVANVSHVINYDVPQHPEDYVHRIGRTGRAQAEGDAFTIFTAEELDHVKAIERFIDQKIKREKLEDFPYKYTALFNESAMVAGGPKASRHRSGYSVGNRRKR